MDSGEGYFDNYLDIKFEEKTNTYIRDILVSLYGDNIYLKYIPDDSGSMKMKGGSSTTTFEEYIADSYNCVYFSAAVVGKADDEEAELAKIKDAFEDVVVCGDIYYFDTNESLETSAKKMIESKAYTKRLDFFKKSVDEYLTTEWTEGV